MKEHEKIEDIEDEVQPTPEGLGDKIGSIAGRARDASKKVGDTASSVHNVAQKASVVGRWRLEHMVTRVQDVAGKAGGAGVAAAGQVQGAAQKAADVGVVAAGQVQGAAQKAADVGVAAAGQVQGAAQKAADVGAAAAGQVQDVSRKAADVGAVAGERVKTHAKKALEAAPSADELLSNAGSSVQGASRKAAGVGAVAGERVKTHAKKASDASGAAANILLSTTSTTWAALAGDLSVPVNDVVQYMVKGSPTIYDKAMDAVYVATHVGGGHYHRLFDGSHTIWGAIKAGHAASPDDNIIQEAIGILQGLLRDVSTPAGLPIANWEPETYKQVAEVLESNFHIPKSWFYDLNTYDAADLLGAAVGVVVLIFSWNRADTETFSKLVAGMGLSAVFTANPLLLILTVVALGKAFHKARQTGEYAEFVDGQFKGAVGTGATLAAVSLVGVAGGPAGAALLAGLAAGILAQYAVKDVKVVEIGKSAAKQVAAAIELTPVTASQISEFAAAQAVNAANEVKSMIERKQLPNLGCGCGCGAAVSVQLT